MTNCTNCTNRPEIVTSLLNYFQDADPVTMMEMLVQMLTCTQNPLSDDQRKELAALHTLLSNLTRQLVENKKAA